MINAFTLYLIAEAKYGFPILVIVMQYARSPGQKVINASR
jgi:hypothetical protein